MTIEWEIDQNTYGLWKGMSNMSETEIPEDKKEKGVQEK